jgi:hypothetical protein
MISVPDEQLNVPYLELGNYQHYKGNAYEVVGVALDSENLQPFVVYKPLYESKVPLWVRPFDMFTGTVTIDTGEVTRLKKV